MIVSPVPASGSFDGIEGTWSTFLINVGDSGDGKSGQNFKILPSTVGSATLLPLESSWCIFPSIITCAEHRGILPYASRQSQGYQSNQSSQYQDLRLFNIIAPLSWNQKQLNGRYGLDAIGLGLASPHSPMLTRQLVTGLQSPEIFVGSLGLSNTLLNIRSKALSPYLANLNFSRAIPSLSFSYTAGANYRYKGVTGSLILGGYDASRFKSGRSFTMPSSTNASLSIGVQSILITPDPHVNQNVYSATAELSGFFVVLDTTHAFLWIPKAVCDVFQTLFKLTYDSTTGLYLVNETAREYNKRQNAIVSMHQC